MGLVAVLLALGLVSAIAVGMAIVAGVEPAVAANGEAAADAGYAADAALAIAAAELQDVADWSSALNGTIRSTILGDQATVIVLADGRVLDLSRLTNLLNCGRAAGCTAGQFDQATEARPWGGDNPRWALYGHGSTAAVWGAGGAPQPFHLVVWVGDDPAESDEDPAVDGAAGQPGGGIMEIRTESFGPRSAHATRTGTLARLPGTSRVRLANRSPGR